MTTTPPNNHPNRRAGRSKVAQLTALLDGALTTPPVTSEGLVAYHAAKAAINACRCKHPLDRLTNVRKALRRFRVMVTWNGAVGPHGLDQVRVYRPDTGKEFIVGGIKS